MSRSDTVATHAWIAPSMLQFIRLTFRPLRQSRCQSDLYRVLGKSPSAWLPRWATSSGRLIAACAAPDSAHAGLRALPAREHLLPLRDAIVVGTTSRNQHTGRASLRNWPIFWKAVRAIGDRRIGTLIDCQPLSKPAPAPPARSPTD